mgnify:CR=1 FL=1
MKERRIAKWISYPGDHEIMLLNKLNMRRRDRELIMPPIWHMCEVYSCVKFARRFTLSAPDEIRIEADGRYNVELDIPGNYLHGDTSVLRLEAGEHSLTVSVFNDRTLPALRVTGSGIVSDGSWQCTAFDGIWKNAAETNGRRAARSACPAAPSHTSACGKKTAACSTISGKRSSARSSLPA